MDSPGSSVIVCEILDGNAADNHRAGVDDNERDTDRNYCSESPVSADCEASDGNTSRNRPADHVMTPPNGENWMVAPSGSASIRTGSEAEGRDEEEDLNLGVREEAICHPRVSEDGTPFSANNSSEGLKASKGGRRVYDGEERRGSPSIADNSSEAESRCGLSGGNCDGDRSGPAGTCSEAAQINQTHSALYRGRQNPPSSLHELAEVLAEPFGSAIATVFYEVFEQSGFVGTDAIAVNDLSRLLEAALKQSLFYVLRKERANFVANFRKSFRSTYKTIRSVRRMCGKTGVRPSGSRLPYLRSFGRSTSKQRLHSENGTRKDSSRRKLEDAFIAETGKEREFGATTSKRLGNRCNHSRQSFSDEEITILNSTSRKEEEPISGPGSSGKSCLDESLQSFLFTDSNVEEDGYPDTSESCSKSCLNESLMSELFSSSSLENGKQLGLARCSSMESGKAALESPLSQATPDARDLRRAHLGTEDSGGDDVFSTCSSEIDDWVVVYRDEAPSETRLLSTSNCLTLRGDGERDCSLVDSQGHLRCQGDTDMSFNTRTVGSWSGSSIHVPESRQPDFPPRVLRNRPAGFFVNDPSASNTPLRTRGSGETSFGPNDERTARSSLYLESQLRREEGVGLDGGADYLGNAHVPSRGRQADSMLIGSTSGQAWDGMTRLTGSSLDESVLLGVAHFQDHEGPAGRPDLIQRYVEAQENEIRLRHLELSHSLKRISILEENLQLQAESNSLMKENLDLSRTKIDLKEYELEDRKLTEAHRELSQMCADELVAGLCLMLLSLAFAGWKFSYARLSKVMTMCQIPTREPRPAGWFGTTWMFNRVDTLGWHLKALTCEVTKAGRMLLGIILIAFVATSFLRRSVTSSSQTMPATIIIVVLGGLCGFAGKISIDSLGGDGFLWVLLWEALCFLHVIATCCTPWLYKYLYGPSSKFYQAKTTFWLKSCSVSIRIFFHTLLVLALPIMAGLLPFASLKELYDVFWEFWELDASIDPF